MQFHGNINKSRIMDRRSILKLLFGAGLAAAIPLSARSKRLFKVMNSKCVGCRDCERICPVAAINFERGKAVIDTETCNGCKLCSAVCTYGAIEQCEKKEKITE
jgi:Fe-S-cluster-containing hydrogenase component 2